MIRAIILILFTSSLSFGQSSYFDSLEIEINDLTPTQKAAKINAIPFEQMNTNIELSIRYYYLALNIADSIKDETLQANLYENLGLVHYYQGDYEKSVDNNLKAIDLFEKLDLKSRAGNVYATLGHQMKGRDLPKAMTHMRIGISLQRAERDTFRLAGSYNNFGWLHQMDGNLDSALHYYNLGLKITTDLNDSLGMPYSLNSVAGVYLERNQFARAKSIYDKAFE
ncbi:MAG: tetratricopeptide repeat protein, partial [Crocinitomicaceae bacterium]